MLRPIHHLGYVVEDLHRDVPRFAAATGAGPFFAMEHIPFVREASAGWDGSGPLRIMTGTPA